jgi:hypothetical protein
VFRGTYEWSSGWADDYREQARWDDIISWFYITVDNMNTSHDKASENQALPWTHRRPNDENGKNVQVIAWCAIRF